MWTVVTVLIALFSLVLLLILVAEKLCITVLTVIIKPAFIAHSSSEVDSFFWLYILKLVTFAF